jgi:8-oxo-dGTP pyrophosphatase MutT (NUDIX family)
MRRMSLREAATVMLLRSGPDERPEVFMVRRHHKTHFMPGAHVFPGGSLDEADHDPAWDARVAGLDAGRAATILGGDVTPRTALALFVAAARECFEEAGVLIAVDAAGRAVTTGPASATERHAPLGEVVAARGLRLDLGHMRYLAHWVTPDSEPRRFDTRFFVTRVPAGTAGEHCGEETTDSRWGTARELLAAADGGEIFVAPPTFQCLKWLASFATSEAALAGAPHAPVPAVMPLMTLDAGELLLRLPGDGDHPVRAPVPGMPRRMRLRDGRWLEEE